jgi:hypothetical protein
MRKRDACIVDEFRYGAWRPRMSVGRSRNGLRFVCADHEFVNETCGQPFSAARFCAALQCRSVLMVGDSVMMTLFLALNTSYRIPRMSNYYCSSVTQNLCATAPGGRCPGGINFTFVRNNHIIVDPSLDKTWAKANGEMLAQNCPIEPHLRRGMYGVVLAGSGLHMDRYSNVKGHDLRADWVWHRAKARSYMKSLRPLLQGTQLIWMKQHWGLLNYTAGPRPPLSEPQEMIPGNWSWNLLPGYNFIAAEAVRSELGSIGAMTIDPTRALAMRPDCRRTPDFWNVEQQTGKGKNHHGDWVHPDGSVLRYSAWPMVQNALETSLQSRTDTRRRGYGTIVEDFWSRAGTSAHVERRRRIL